jgi:hypothetical protein
MFELGPKVETDKPENLKKELLKNGYSSGAAEKIVEHYTIQDEDF